MKRFIVFFVLLLPLLAFTDPRSWIYVNPQVVQDTSPYDAALQNADLDKYRYFDKRNTLHFESGLDVELLSANEMIAQGLPLKRDHVRTEEPAFDTKPVFRLTTDGKILEVQTRVKIK